ncbi:MAG: hypothetical protein V4772_24270, partial [Pseudomonadota bacterium]
ATAVQPDGLPAKPQILRWWRFNGIKSFHAYTVFVDDGLIRLDSPYLPNLPIVISCYDSLKPSLSA